MARYAFMMLQRRTAWTEATSASGVNPGFGQCRKKALLDTRFNLLRRQGRRHLPCSVILVDRHGEIAWTLQDGRAVQTSEWTVYSFMVCNWVEAKWPSSQETFAIVFRLTPNAVALGLKNGWFCPSSSLVSHNQRQVECVKNQTKLNQAVNPGGPLCTYEYNPC